MCVFLTYLLGSWNKSQAKRNLLYSAFATGCYSNQPIEKINCIGTAYIWLLYRHLKNAQIRLCGYAS